MEKQSLMCVHYQEECWPGYIPVSWFSLLLTHAGYCSAPPLWARCGKCYNLMLVCRSFYYAFSKTLCFMSANTATLMSTEMFNGRYSSISDTAAQKVRPWTEMSLPWALQGCLMNLQSLQRGWKQCKKFEVIWNKIPFSRKIKFSPRIEHNSQKYTHGLSGSLKRGVGISLEPRLSVPDFVSQFWSCETKSGTESLGLKLGGHIFESCDICLENTPTSHVASWSSPIYVCMQWFCNASSVMHLLMQ